MKKREVGQVSFSLFDAYESGLWEHAKKQGAFSKYVKRLIDQDINKRVTQIQPSDIYIAANDDSDKEAVKGFL